MDCTRSPDKLARFLNALSEDELEYLSHEWQIFARADQCAPEPEKPWRNWLVLGGRGAGKTRTGAEWVRHLALAPQPISPIALVAESLHDLREIMVEGTSGLLAIHPKATRPQWHAGRRRLEWPNGAVAQGFSAEDPESLRGPQFAAAWCDELAKWRAPEAAFSNLQFALRLGAAPQCVITTTPRPLPLLKVLMAAEDTMVTRATTAQNAYHLAPEFISQMQRAYGGTRLGRQELYGEIIEDVEGALFTRDMIEAARVPAFAAKNAAQYNAAKNAKSQFLESEIASFESEIAAQQFRSNFSRDSDIASQQLPDFARVIVAVDPPAGGKRGGGCGIIVAARDKAGVVYVLEDASLQGARPEAWAARVLAAYHAHEADALIVEVNQGGDMVRAVLASLDADVPINPVRAVVGKRLRAEPVASLYTQGRVKHCGAFPALEDEMTSFTPDGLSHGRSPDRLDALVWAVTELALNGGGKKVVPRVRMT